MVTFSLYISQILSTFLPTFFPYLAQIWPTLWPIYGPHLNYGKGSNLEKGWYIMLFAIYYEMYFKICSYSLQEFSFVINLIVYFLSINYYWNIIKCVLFLFPAISFHMWFFLLFSNSGYNLGLLTLTKFEIIYINIF